MVHYFLNIYSIVHKKQAQTVQRNEVINRQRTKRQIETQKYRKKDFKIRKKSVIEHNMSICIKRLFLGKQANKVKK